LEICGW